MQSTQDALDGGFAVPPIDAAHAFRAILEAMARPGTIWPVKGATPPAPLSPAAGAVLLTLCDPETGLFLAGSHDTPEIRAWIAFHTGAPLVGPGECSFALGDWTALAPLTRYRAGRADYPDRSATLIVERDSLRPEGATLTGPGIRDRAALNLPEIAAFRANARLFPCGLDFIFTCEDRVAALPRSTTVTEG